MQSDESEEWAGRILKARLTFGASRGRPLSQEEMGAMVGVGQRAVASWEQGRKRPGVDTYLELATALNVDPGWLAFGIESVGGRVVDKPNPNTVPMLGTANANERPATEVLHVPTAADIRARQEAAKKKGKKA